MQSSKKVREVFEELNKLRHLLNSVAFHKPGPVEDHDYLERAFEFLIFQKGGFTKSSIVKKIKKKAHKSTTDLTWPARRVGICSYIYSL